MFLYFSSLFFQSFPILSGSTRGPNRGLRAVVQKIHITDIFYQAIKPEQNQSSPKSSLWLTQMPQHCPEQFYRIDRANNKLSTLCAPNELENEKSIR
jgi:hypothetical protein